MTVIAGTSRRLTPGKVQAVAFPAARLGRRGYDEEHVRAFCGQVEAELVRLLNEKTALEEEVQRLRQRVLGGTGPDDGAGYRREDAHIQAVRVLSKAQQTADSYVADAQDYSRQLAHDARRRRDEILAEARTHAAHVMEEAHSQASTAAAAAMSGPAEVPAADRRELEAELAYLRTFCDVYRTHLRAYLDALLRNVEEWERAEKSSLSARAELLPMRIPDRPLP
ncbi:MAG TPA: DivIVA domain-containing protein [Streptosporangiaceae bacterium]|jgi:DivIVA domain-containing protein